MAARKQKTQAEANILEQLAGFDDLNNMFGKIGPDIRKRLLKVLAKPTDRTWEDAHSIIIQGFMTLWQAWVATDPTAPRVGPSSDAKGRRLERWFRVPTSEELFAAIRYAANQKVRV